MEALQRAAMDDARRSHKLRAERNSITIMDIQKFALKDAKAERFLKSILAQDDLEAKKYKKLEKDFGSKPSSSRYSFMDNKYKNDSNTRPRSNLNLPYHQQATPKSTPNSLFGDSSKPVLKDGAYLPDILPDISPTAASVKMGAKSTKVTSRGSRNANNRSSDYTLPSIDQSIITIENLDPTITNDSAPNTPRS